MSTKLDMVEIAREVEGDEIRNLRAEKLREILLTLAFAAPTPRPRIEMKP